jgi:hypothetical protein
MSELYTSGMFRQAFNAALSPVFLVVGYAMICDSWREWGGNKWAGPESGKVEFAKTKLPVGNSGRNAGLAVCGRA